MECKTNCATAVISVKSSTESKQVGNSSCNACGSTNTYGMSRVVGYYSIIENWNSSKQAEFKDRQQGCYGLGQKPQEVMQEVVLVH